MSIASLCDKNLIVVTPQSYAAGASWGATPAAGAPFERRCLVQEMDASESQEFDARGLRVSHTLFFPSDPGIRLGDMVSHAGDTLRVTGAYKEGRPGEDMLWIVYANKLDTRDR